MSIKAKVEGLLVTGIISILGLAMFFGSAPIQSGRVASEEVIESIEGQTVRLEHDCGAFGTGVVFLEGGHVFVVTANHVATHHTNSPALTTRSGADFQTRVVSADAEFDLALLEVLEPRGSFQISARLSRDDTPLPVGTILLHVGNWDNPDDRFSFSTGVVSANSREIAPGIFDQSTLIAYPGSSGGGLFEIEGDCVGILLRGHSQGRIYYAPVWIIKTWAAKHAYFWMFE